MNKSPVSVCMIAGAEAHRIGRALESVAPWAAEIIVVLNQEVADGTEEIAEKYGAKVFREPWKGFVIQKNSVAQKAAQKWILGLDADEVVSPELRDQILGAVGQGATAGAPAAYEFSRLSFYCGRWIRHGDWYPDRTVRLWQSDKATVGGIEPHAHMVVQGSVGRLRGDLLHYTSETISHQILKIGPYQKHQVERWVAEGRHVGFFGMVIRPWWRFMRAYLFRLGFLDGWQGFYIAKMSAFSTLTRQAMVLEARSAKAGPS